MKKIKKIVAILCVLATVIAAFSITADAAFISKSKQSVTGVKGGQTVFVTTSKKWNSNFPGGMFNTVLKITLPVMFRDLFCKDSSGQNAKIRVTTFKKAGKGWVKQNKLSGSYFCNAYSGVLSKTFRLPGKGVQYKIMITPERQSALKAPSDLTGIQVELSNNGTVDTVR